MKGFFIKIGRVNKKLIMLGILTVLYIIMDIIEVTTKMDKLHIILDLYTRGISYTAIIIVPAVLKCMDKKNKAEKKDKEDKEESRCTKKSILHFCILHVIYILYFVVNILLISMKKKLPEGAAEDFQMSHYHGLCIEEAIEIIFILIVSKILIKTKLYIHHYIGLVIFIAFSLGIDILVDVSLFKPGFKFIAVYIVYLIIDSMFITFEKYMMDKLYYSPYIVVCSIGILFLVAATFFTILIICGGDKLPESVRYKLQDFGEYFRQHDYKKVIGHLVYLTSFRFVLNILKILTIYYFTQNHIYSSYVFIKLVDYLIKKKTWKKYLCIILFIFQFFGILVYIEILELNFLGLNKNTKKNVELREIKEEGNMLLTDDDSRLSDVGKDEKGKKINKVEIAPGYTVTTEMVNMNQTSRDSSGFQDSRDSSGFNDSRNSNGFNDSRNSNGFNDSRNSNGNDSNNHKNNGNNQKDENCNFELTQHKDDQ